MSVKEVQAIKISLSDPYARSCREFRNHSNSQCQTQHTIHPHVFLPCHQEKLLGLKLRGKNMRSLRIGTGSEISQASPAVSRRKYPLLSSTKQSLQLRLPPLGWHYAVVTQQENDLFQKKMILCKRTELTVRCQRRDHKENVTNRMRKNSRRD